MEFVSGFDCLGAEETTSDKTLSVIKKVGPGLVSSVLEAVDTKKKPDETKDEPKSGKGKKYKEGFWSNLSTLGKVGVVLGGVAGAVGLGFAVKAIVKR